MQHFYENEDYGPRTPLAFQRIQGLSAVMEIGVLPTEQGRDQRVQIDAIIGYPASMSRLASDDLSTSSARFSTEDAYARITEIVSRPTRHVETLAHRICDSILEVEGALTVELTVTRSHPWANVEKSSLTIFREK
jgi:dihydroneopterin aldolase